MKGTLCTLLLATLLTGQASAQYFQHKYAPATFIGTRLMNGQFTRTTGPGHLAGGQHIRDLDITIGDYGIYVLRTDENGRFSSPNNFNRTYYVTHSGTGIQVRFTAAQVVEFSDGSGYGAIGSFMTQADLLSSYQNQGLAYIRLDLSGNVVSVQGYSLGNVTSQIPTLTGLRQSISDPNALFATGTMGGPGFHTMWAMKINQAGNLQWGSFYDIAEGNGYPTDLIESPYANNLIVIGDYNDDSTGVQRGFWMDLDPSTGSLSNAYVVSSFMGNADRLHSIDVVPGTGYILSGTSDGRAWVVKTMSNGNSLWSNQYWSMANPSYTLQGHDATAGFNPITGREEYCATGAFFSNPNNGDAFMLKLDANGTPINPNGMFHYDSGREETGNDIDWMNNGTEDGIGIYAIIEGTAGSPQKEGYVVKTDFTGYSGCNDMYEDVDKRIVEFGKHKDLTVSTSSFSEDNVSFRNYLDLTDEEICLTGARGTGSFGRTAPEMVSTASLSPNPVVAGTHTTLQLELSGDEQVAVTVYDISGRRCQQLLLEGRSGSNTYKIPVSGNMPAGMYTVNVKGNTINRNMLLSVR